MRKKFLVNALLVLAILLVVGGSAAVIAYMFRETQVEENLLVPAEVSCSVAEEFDGTEKTSIMVTNTGNIDAYIRVRLVTYWVNEDGNVAPKSSAELNISYNNEYWIKGANNTYYYKYKVPPNSGNVTNELLSNSITLTEADGCRQVVDVFAEAIQANPAEAVSSWPEVTVNSDNTLSLKTSGS